MEPVNGLHTPSPHSTDIYSSKSDNIETELSTANIAESQKNKRGRPKKQKRGKNLKQNIPAFLLYNYVTFHEFIWGLILPT